jgi:hypothetical protein
MKFSLRMFDSFVLREEFWYWCRANITNVSNTNYPGLAELQQEVQSLDSKPLQGMSVLKQIHVCKI